MRHAHPDADLLAKCDAWLASNMKTDELYAKAEKACQDEAEKAAEDAHAETWALYEQIASADARTVEGLAAQARVLVTSGNFDHSECEVSMSLIRRIAINLQALAGLEAPKAAA